MSFSDDHDDRRGGGMGLDLRYWAWVLRRRFWLFAVIAALMSGGGLGVALILPPVYEARASMLVESQQIPTDLVRSTVSASASEQIEVIKQRLLTRDVLLELASRHDVFPDADRMTPTQRVNAMRADIVFTQRTLGDLRGYRPGDTVSTSFSVSFRADTGQKAAAVVNDLVTRILRQGAELRRARAETTADYFRQDVARLSADLAQMEARIVAFQEENSEALPESLEYRRSQLDLLQERLQRFELEHIDLEQERASLQLTLDADPETALDGGRLTENMRELATLRRAMVQRRAILAESHPDIRALASRIRALEAAVAEEGEILDTADAAARTAADSRLPPELRDARRRIALIDARMAFTDEVIASLKEERDALETSLLETPNIQMELNALQRAYRNLEDRYAIARAKLNEAEAGEQLEDKQQGERFEVIEQAIVPDEPAAPNRKAYAVLGVGGGFGAGLGLIVLLELVSGVVRRPEDLTAIGRAPVAVIPYISTDGERRRLWAGRIAAFALIVGGGAAALWSIHTYYLPLETVLEKVLEKLQLDGTLDMVRRRLGL